MIRNGLVVLVALALSVGCGASSTDSSEHAHHGGGEGHHHEGAPPEPSRVLEDGSRLFGAELDPARDVVALADILAAPERFSGQVVKTEGEISAVCQRMGCWMELRTDADSPGIRVPMANHAFFLPRDLAGTRATIEGTVHLEPLSAEDREHLESEGATATGGDLSIEASGVLVHP